MLHQKRYHTPRRRLVTSIILALAVIAGLFPQAIPGGSVPAASAHNLQTRMVYMYMDPATQSLLDARMAAPGWTPPEPLLQVGDEIGLIIKVVPRDGTNTGVGGHIDFYVPNGVTVVDAAYVIPDGAGGYVPMAMKGQSPIAIGDGSIGAKTTTEMAGIPAVGPNINGVTELPASATGLHRGTIAGLYGDTGIFYATDPDTAYGSWQRFTGDWNSSGDNKCGSLAFTTANGKTITNNSGDVVVPCNKWDAEQLFAWGAKATTYNTTGWPHLPIVDYGDGRGNAPWGFAAGTAGPQSGYAWNFNWDEWRVSAKDKPAVQAAMGNDEIGPWQRIKYFGSRISLDQAGLASTEIGYANVDGSNVGFALSPSTPLPASVSQTDATSPKVIRWAVGQLTQYRPEYAWVKVKVNNAFVGITEPSRCLSFRGDTFGGDAGGTNNGKDHLWRYYEPTEAVLNTCVAGGKPATREFVQNGDVFQYKIKVYNFQDFALTSLVVRDALPSRVTFLSATPAQNSGPNPLVWNVGTLLPGQKFEATVTVKANGTGPLDNCMEIASAQLPTQTVCDSTQTDTYPYLAPSKTASATSVVPGGTLQYTVTVRNIGTGPTASPVTIDEYLPTGFTFVSKDRVTVNGADVTTATSVSTASPYSANRPHFSVPAALNAGQSLVIKFTAQAPANAAAGSYCNYFAVTQGGIPLTTGSLACVTVSGAQIGDTVYRDWDGDGVQDAAEKGIAGVTVKLYASNGTTLLATTTTDANGRYLFAGLAAGSYVVQVNNGLALLSTTLTGDPDGVLDNRHTVVLAADQEYLTADFGYQPGGPTGQGGEDIFGIIGDRVFEDVWGDGLFTAGVDTGIAGVTVYLYEDSNGDGIITSGMDALVGTRITDASGVYGFSFLGEHYDYMAYVNPTDPALAAYFGADPYRASAVNPHPVDNLTGSYLDADFGYSRIVPGSIGDQVFIDANGNNTYEAGVDTPLPNVGLILYQDAGTIGVLDSADVAIRSASSSISGTYTFGSLPAGNYLVDVDQNDGDIPASYESALADPRAVTLSASQVRTDVDFPFRYVPPRLSKAVDKATAQPGDTLYYTLTTAYTGGGLLTNAIVTDTVPAGTTYVAGSANAGGAQSGDVVTWTLGSNAAGVPGLTTGGSSSGGTTTYTVTLYAVADTYIDEQDHVTSFGSLTTMRTEPSPVGQRKYSLVRFDVSSIPSSATVQTATLGVYVSTPQSSHVDPVYSMVTGWTEAATWDDGDGAGAGDWVSAGGIFGTSDYNSTSLGSITPSSSGYKTLNVTSAAQGWVSNSTTNKGLLIASTGADVTDAFYATREAGSNIPYLTVTYQAAAATTGMAVWQHYPATTATKYNPWNGITFTVSSNTASLGAISKGLRGASAPARNEKIVLGTDASSALQGEVWNGYAWTLIPGTSLGSPSGFGTGWDYDVIYEQQSGDALIAFADGNNLKYATWNGTSWSAATTVSDYATLSGGSSPVRRINLAAKPGSNEIVMVVTENVQKTAAWVWNGSSFGSGVLLNASGSSQQASGAAYERQTGRPMAIYGKSADPKVYYRFWNGSAWSAESSLDPSVSPVVSTCAPDWILLASDPTSDRIGIGVQTANCGSSNRLWAGVWDGSTWASRVPMTVQPTAYTYPNLALAWESQSGELLVAFGDSAATNVVKYSTWSSSGLWSLGASGPNVAATTNYMLLEPDPYSDQIMLAVQNSAADLYYARWPGAAPFDAPIRLETDTYSLLNQPFAFLWDNIPWTGSQVSQSSDDAEEVGPDGGTDPTRGGPGAVVVISSDLEMVQDLETISSGTQIVGMRFNGLNVPKGATITNAFMAFRAVAADTSNSNSGTTNLTIQGQATDNAPTFVGSSSPTYSISTRPRTTASVAWSPAAWTTGTDYSTSNLKTVVQEIVNRAGWASGNSMAFIVTGTGSRSAEAWDNTGETGTDGTNQPRLVIEYARSSSGPALGNVMTTTPTLVTAGSRITVTQVLTSSQNIANVTPVSVTITATNGVSATLLSGPTPISATVGITGTVFTWVYTATAGSSVGQLTFGAAASGGSNTWRQAASNSVIVAPPLTFRATVNSPAGVTVISNTAYLKDASGALPLSPSNTVRTAVGASIGDRVWADLDGDGVQDTGEPGLGGVQVCVTPGAACATTDGSGFYQIAGLNAGTYTVAVSVPVGYQPTTPTSLSVSLAAGQVYTVADFGLRSPGAGSIGDTVWLDADADGVVDAGESGLPGITLRLYNDKNNSGAVDAGDLLLGTTTTSVTGTYAFTGLYAGDYLVVVDTASVVTTSFGVTSTLAAGMDLVSGSNPADVTLASGQNYTTADFGYRWAGSIGDYVWWDNNRNQLQDESPATPIAGAAVLLYYDVNANGVLDLVGQPGDTQIGFAMSNGSGAYLFTNLGPGRYLVDVYEDSMTTDGVRDVVPTTSDVVFVNLAASQDYLAADFGYYVGALVQGNVFWDANRNGVLDAAERDAAHLLENVTVNIVCYGADGAPGGGDDFTGSMDTGTGGLPDGYFRFIVTAGPCTLTYDQGDIPAVYGDRTTPTTYSFNAEAGEDWHPSFDFGVDNSGRIGDTVYVDANNNRTQDAGESGLAGVTVDLYDGSSATLLDVAVTDARGRYLFAGLADGSYRVAPVGSTLPAGYGLTTANAPYSASISGGSSNLNADFGYRLGGPSGANAWSIGGTVFEDLDGNGFYSFGVEPAIVGATVVVTCTSGIYQAISEPAGPGGNWLVSGIPQGDNCTIDVLEATLPSNALVATTPATRTVTNLQSDVYDQDFGYQRRFAALGGKVVVGDGDGVAETGESPLQGVTITLRYAGADGFLGTGDDVISTTLTSASGFYTFTGLLPGLYQVSETDLPGYYSLADRDGGNPNNITVSNLAAGQTLGGRDFEDALIPVANVALAKRLVSPGRTTFIVGEQVSFQVVVTNTGTSSLVYLPLNDQFDSACLRYGMKGASPIESNYDNGVSPGTVNWLNLVTSFGSKLTPGQTFTITIPFDVVGASASGFNTATVSGARDTLGQTAATVSDTVNFTCVQPGRIGDTVYTDRDGDGVQDPGETGLAGVVVRLQQPSGVTITTTTSITGFYRFNMLPPGAYTVTVDAATIPAGYALTTGNSVLPVNLTAGQNYDTADFGYRPLPVTIGDRACIDNYPNGFCDDNDLGLVGIPLRVTGRDVFGASVDITVTTSITGFYLVNTLVPGVYTVTARDSGGFRLVSEPVLTTTLPVGGGRNLALDFIFAMPTAVQVNAPAIAIRPGEVRLSWTVQLYGLAAPEFHVWRAAGGGAWKRLTAAPLGSVSGDGETATYIFADTAIAQGVSYLYRLETTAGEDFGPWSVRVPAASDTRRFMPLVVR